MKSPRAALLSLSLTLLLPLASAADKPLPPGVTRVPVTFTGGHETVGEDKGRPVVLIAAALGVKPEVFREAFSHVRPAGPNRGPTDEEARANKAALMNALGKHGITNDRLDEVSNYYRYMRSKGQMWQHHDAVVNALVKDGAVTSYEIVDAGAGYSSPPAVAVTGIKDAPAKVELAFGKDLSKNGSIAAITVSKQELVR